MRLAFFVDFDGTITLEDTCDILLSRHGNPKLWEINQRWENKEISSRECISACLAEMKLTPEDIQRVVREVPIDPYFKTFLQLAGQRQYPVYILSDGYQQIIQGVLDREKITVPFYANRLEYPAPITASFPYYNEECGRCGTCKNGIIKQLIKPGEQRVYLGDGASDFCAAAGCEIIFARGKLARYCQGQQIPYNNFPDFQEVIKWLEQRDK
ncbi:MtnX-like HAD-IB family phosphatase [Desulforamulus ferrireducens]|uniref:2-hydroxy-3-keto-5-methylthiopentenyl-1-phosphate phosphatase n=1 Tax=Desulforamulus ferrireducens TaxID=1833852 RepID=A0A1S6ISU2_9FIRM|nr:MtnX-like HAD-IB family phosphatase [Desulforamulus ferrireducens]AQS57832.1 hypothetical protein B0537_01145 [Desulforamulus ferrireducens]